jgi:cell division protein FtsA
MIIEARLREIVSMAYWEIKRAGFENRLVGGIVVTGGTANLHNIRELIEYTTGMDTRVGWPSECLAGGMVPEVTNPKYSTATGLLMQSLYNRLPLAQRNATASRNNAQGQEKASAKSLDPESKIMNLVKSWINSTFNSPNQVD